jgi:GTP-binding protein Era
MNVRMVDAALETIGEVDVVAALIDVSVTIGSGDRFVLERLRNIAEPVVLVLNKVDRVAKAGLLPLIDALSHEYVFAEIVPVSALTGENVDRLEEVFLNLLTDQPERVIVAEIVREQVLRHTRAEIPFSTAVVVDRFEEPDDSGLMRLYCTILVERDSQKPIIVGRGGGMIKQIGTAARLGLERFFQTRVYLDLRVKVRSGWREDERTLDDLGLGPKSRA